MVVHRLGSSLQNLQIPICPRCQVEMKWFESRLVEREPSLVMEHTFVCVTCGGLSERREVEGNSPVPPLKLMRWRHMMARAA